MIKKPRETWLERFKKALIKKPKNQQQLLQLLRQSTERNLMAHDALSMMEGVLQVSHMQVRDIMIPRAQMVTVSEQQTLAEFLPHLIESGHSRFPVIGENRDEVIGILHAKDLLPFLNDPNAKFNFKDILRPAVYIPDSKRLNVLLRDFRRTHHHMAIVVDEYGGVSGCVTIEDVLEQIVGEIEDEFDVNEEAFIKPLSETEYTVKATTPLEDFNAYFSENFDTKAYDTLGGLINKSFGHIPSRGEKITLGRFTFEVLRADNRRVHLLKMTL